MSFKEVKGQDEIIELLARAINKRRSASAYLFVGPEGVGKSLVAANVAKLLHCRKRVDNGLDSCGVCTSCLKINNLNHPDVTWIAPDAESGRIRIEHIRGMQRDISLKPYEGEIKIFIILEAQCMTGDASNALLKTLEEPPGAALLILTSSNPMLLFPTIVSRCQKFKFSPLRLEEIKEILIKGHNLDAVKAHFLAAISEGKLGKALRLKDENILERRDEIINQLSVFSSQFSDKDKGQIEETLEIVLSWYRDILVLKSGLDSSMLINRDRKEDIRSQMKNLSFADLETAIKRIDQTRNLINRNVNVKLALDVMGLELKG